MKIAIVINSLRIGGMETVLFMFSQELRRMGYDVSYVVTECEGAWHERPLNDGFPVIEVFQNKWQSRRGHALNIAKYLSEFDVVILNNSRAGQSCLGLLPESIITLSVLHNPDEGTIKGGAFNQYNLDGVIAVSPGVYNNAIDGGIDKGKLFCVKNGVSPINKWSKDGRCDIGLLKLVYLGRLQHWQKGVLDLPAIIQRVNDAGVNTSLDIIGEGPDGRELQRRFFSILPKYKVKFHGGKPHDSALSILEDMDVLIMPSRFEGLPIAPLEAMMRGIVPVIYNLRGITDQIIEPGISGFLPEPGNIDEFASAIICLKDRALLGKISREAWCNALKDFNINKMARGYIHIINEIKEGKQKVITSRRTGYLDRITLGGMGQYLPKNILRFITLR